MNTNILVYAERLRSGIPGIVYELLGKARALAEAHGSDISVLLPGPATEEEVASFGAAHRVLIVEHDAATSPTPEGMLQSVHDAAALTQPGLLLMPATTLASDVAALFAADTGARLVTNCIDFDITHDGITACSRQYGGKILVDVLVDSTPAVLCVLAGAFQEQEGCVTGTPSPVKLPSPVLPDQRMRATRFIPPAPGDVDLAQMPVLLSVGRGIQNKENIGIVEELASKLNGAVCASRPVIDQGWLPLTRQIGRSGLMVKPRVYMAFGISGAPEHVEGMKDAGLIIAINTDRTAPIFNVAHYGVAADALDVVPALLEALENVVQHT
ncbi:MAG: electron transfer flavoprotein subunit alpha/FixB family protein [Ignavibacteriae bacterium]|nr:electron transfer flavoprotein subunit alpha/FixB family protein [Ignavibacteriota bacterium]